jgi:C4-dicarboxylate-specific signal transduction histidine kinase
MAHETSAQRPHRSILLRTVIFSNAIVLLALVLLLLFIIPYQRSMLKDRLDSTAQVVATSIAQVTITSIVIEDYSPVIEHCMKVVQERPAVLYLTITRKDGFSLVHQKSGWRYEQLYDNWQPSLAGGDFTDSKLAGQRVFHFSYPVSYSGIDWGWIHVGLSLDQFNRDLRSIYLRTVLLALLSLAISALVALAFARKLVRPIQELSSFTQRVAAGDLEGRVLIETGDETEALSHSFNQMTMALQEARDGLENHVEERTADLRAATQQLAAANKELQDQIGERLRVEAELETQRTLQMRSDRLRSLGEMAAGIAHELNQPLVGVRGLAEHTLLGQERGWELKAETLQERMEQIIAQADRMVHIIDHVRRFAREAGRPEMTTVQLNDVVQSALSLLQVQLRTHGVSLSTHLAADLPLIYANSFSIEEVALNLLNNARDAVEEKMAADKLTSGWIKVETGHSPDEVWVQISDNGTGIAADLQEKIFDPFFTTKDPDKGTGLGLSISRTIIEEHDGRIEVQSTPGQGTSITIALPIEPRAAQSA